MTFLGAIRTVAAVALTNQMSESHQFADETNLEDIHKSSWYELVLTLFDHSTNIRSRVNNFRTATCFC